MPSKLIENPNSIGDVADWVEFFIFAKKESLSKAQLSSYIEDSSGSEPEQSVLDDVWLELERRIILYGNKCPYELADREIIPLNSWEDVPEYTTCVILSIDGNATETVLTGKLFERLSCKAVRKYIGGEAIIYGFPSKQTVKSIAQTLNETFIKEPSSNFNDRGVDIISWKNFGDNRSSQIAILIQCAAGANWRKKLLEVPYKAWTQYIHWGADPLKGFTAPIIVGEAKYEDTVTDAGIMLDRSRIFRNVDYECGVDIQLTQDLINWCKPRIESFINS